MMTACGQAILYFVPGTASAFRNARHGSLTGESLGEDRLQDMLSYMSGACLASIILSNGKDSGDKSLKFVFISTELQEESAENRLLSLKYVNLHCGRGSQARQHRGGKYDMVGNVWASKYTEMP